MDPTAVNANITVDDFDSILKWPDNAAWSTPDPSSRGFDGNNPLCLRGTFHRTSTKNAEVQLNFTGPALYIYGHKGSQYGSFRVQIDSATSEHSAYDANANSTAPTLLYAASNLTYAPHALTLTNIGAVEANGDAGGDEFLLDFLQFTVQLGPAGATVRNVTLEEDSPNITYTGVWGTNTGPVFSGGGTTYTNADRATASLSFRGSAIYVLGDIKNDHRIFGVKVDDKPEEFHNGTSGCGGAFGLTCEQQVPILKYLGSNLDDSEHTLTITNYASVNNSFFDLDSIVIVETSQYAPREIVSSDSPFVNGSSSGTGGGSSGGSGAGGGVGTGQSGNGTQSNNNNNGGQSTAVSSLSGLGLWGNPFFLIFLSMLFLFRRKI